MENLPGYTTAPVAGELSLGRGGKKQFETQMAERTSVDAVIAQVENKDEVLPPYVPPPPPTIQASSRGRMSKVKGHEAVRWVYPRQSQPGHR